MVFSMLTILTIQLRCTIHLQAVLAAAPPWDRNGGHGPRSLHIGLGVGTAVKGLQHAGVETGGYSGLLPEWLVQCRLNGGIPRKHLVR